MDAAKGFTLGSLLATRARKYGGKPLAGFGQDGGVISYEALNKKARQLGVQLASLGVRQGDRVGLVLSGDRAFLQALWASLWLKAVPVLVDVRSGLRTITKMFKDAGVSSAIAEKDQFTALPNLWKRLNPEARVLWWEDVDRPEEGGCGGNKYQLHPQALSEQAEASRVALITFTSGLTGHPKPVQLTHEKILTSAASIAAWLHLGEEDCVITPLSLYHVNILVVGLLASLWAGGSLVAARSWFSGDTKGLNLKTSWALVSPDLITTATGEIRLDSHPPIKQLWRFVLSTGAPLPTAVQRNFEGIFQVPLANSYGLAETAGIACCNPVPAEKEVNHDAWRRRPGSVGQPVGWDVLITGPSGRPAEPEEVGEITLCPAGKAPREDAETIFTGDLGYIDMDNYVYVVSRNTEVISYDGHALYPFQMEEQLFALDGVRDAVIIGVPDPFHGERPVAYIVPEDDAPASSLTSNLIANLGIEIRTCRRIPRTTLGKVDKPKMIKEYLEEM